MAADEPICVEPATPIREVLRRLKEGGTDSVLVCEVGKLVGIFTERDAVRWMADADRVDGPVSQYMTSEPVTVTIDETVGSAIHKMAVGGYRRLPRVNNEGAPVGMLTVSHILHYLVEHFPRVVYTLPPTPKHSTQKREGA